AIKNGSSRLTSSVTFTA
ncbi:DNA polymerase III, subunit gamma and tau, partial [Vibrio parahaemolyticus AQ3810]